MQTCHRFTHIFSIQAMHNPPHTRGVFLPGVSTCASAVIAPCLANGRSKHLADSELTKYTITNVSVCVFAETWNVPANIWTETLVTMSFLISDVLCAYSLWLHEYINSSNAKSVHTKQFDDVRLRQIAYTTSLCQYGAVNVKSYTHFSMWKFGAQILRLCDLARIFIIEFNLCVHIYISV